MLLAIDIGNTLTDFGFFEGEELKKKFSIRSEANRSHDEIVASFSLLLSQTGIKEKEIHRVIISSVVPSLLTIYRDLSQELFGVSARVVGPGLKTGVRVNVDEPKEVGADLIADSAGALSRFGNCCLIADLGTATKILLIDQSGSFAGCTIGAGLGISLDAMVSKTAALPEISLQIPAKIIGKNTVDCMNSALTYGSAFQIRALSDAIEKEVGYPLRRILTGGYSRYIATLLPEFEHEPDLCLIGLNAIDRRNQK